MTTDSESVRDTPTRDEIIELGRELVATELKLDPAEVTADVHLRELDGADSVRLLRVVARLERHYDLEFDDEDIFTTDTIGHFANLVLAALTEE